jgi:hypothetical protein
MHNVNAYRPTVFQGKYLDILHSIKENGEKFAIKIITIYIFHLKLRPVTVTERSEASTVFARSEAGIVGSNPTKGMDVWCVYLFIMCLCCPVFM